MEKIKKYLENPKFIKYQTAILGGFAVLLCTLLIAFLIVPQTYSLIATNNQISELEKKQINLSEKLSLIETLDVGEYKRGLNASLVALPDDRDLPGTIGHVLSLISSSGLSLEDFAFSNPQTDPTGVQSFNASLNVSGTRASIQSLFEKIKQNPRIMRVGRLEINSSASISKNQANIDIIIFYQPLPASIGDIEQPLVLLSPQEKELLANLSRNLSSVSIIPIGTESASTVVGKSDPFQ